MIAILWCNGKTPSNDLIKRVLTKGKKIFGVDGGQHDKTHRMIRDTIFGFDTLSIFGRANRS